VTGVFQIVPIAVTNPYIPPRTAESLSTTQSPTWLGRSIILNVTLLSIPLVALVGAYAYIRLSTAWESATQTGDPVVYQHFFWINVDPWFAIAYFLVPNGILAGLFAIWKFRSAKEKLNDDAVA
jgi:hypothetical protein